MIRVRVRVQQCRRRCCCGGGARAYTRSSTRTAYRYRAVLSMRHGRRAAECGGSRAGAVAVQQRHGTRLQHGASSMEQQLLQHSTTTTATSTAGGAGYGRTDQQPRAHQVTQHSLVWSRSVTAPAACVRVWDGVMMTIPRNNETAETFVSSRRVAVSLFPRRLLSPAPLAPLLRTLEARS